MYNDGITFWKVRWRRMSQAKVDARKEQKKNRKQEVAKQKRNRVISRLVSYVVVIAIVGAIGFSVYKKVNPGPKADSTIYSSLIATDSYGILQPSIPDTDSESN